jgi:hypothetical protein
VNPVGLTRAEEERERASEQATVQVPLCVACGEYHGGVMAELLCLRAALLEARRKLGELNR